MMRLKKMSNNENSSNIRKQQNYNTEYLHNLYLWIKEFITFES